MARPDPERIFAARKAATLERLVTENRLPLAEASAWIELVLVSAGDHDKAPSPAFWEDAYRIIVAEFEAGRPPTKAFDASRP